MPETQNIDTPHERRPFRDHGHMDVITLGDFTLGRGVFEPGWRWSNDVSLDPGHDAWAVGDEPCIMLDTGVAAYAKPASHEGTS